MGLALDWFLRRPTLLAIRIRRRRRSTVKVDGAAVRNILVVRLDGLGDLVMTTPLFQELKRLYPAARVSLVTQARFADLVAGDPHVDRVLKYVPSSARGVWKRAARLGQLVRFARQQLRDERFDLAISPRWDVDTHGATLLCILADAKVRVGYVSATTATKAIVNKGFDDAYDICVPAGPVQHEVQRNLEVARALGGQVMGRGTKIYIRDQDRDFADSFLGRSSSESLVVALGVGTQSRFRRWPMERYLGWLAQMAESLAGSPLLPVVVCGPEERKTYAEALQLSWKAPFRILDRQDLRETCAVLERCSL